MNVAQKFISEKGYPLWTKVKRFPKLCVHAHVNQKNEQVLRVVDGGEPTLFKQYFASWKEDAADSHPIPMVIKNNQIAGLFSS